MAHFAILNENNIVENVVVIPNDQITRDGIESEEAGIEYLSNIFNHKNIKQTSYNGKIRKNFAGIGYYYDQELDAFIPLKKHKSWIFDSNKYHYVPPIEYPKDGKKYIWVETVKNWVEEAR
jgi:hypothetical protein